MIIKTDIQSYYAIFSLGPRIEYFCGQVTSLVLLVNRLSREGVQRSYEAILS